MIRRSPAEVYIKYLLVHPNGYTMDQVKETLLFAKLDYLGDWYLTRLRASMSLPVPFYPKDPKHRPSQRFLLENGLHDLFFPDRAVKDAFKLLKYPRCKQWVDAMLTCFVPPEDISAQLARAMGFSCDAEVIKRYSDIFCNPNLLDVDEMRALVDFRSEQLAHHQDADIRAQYEAVKSASYRSAGRTAANLPMSPITSMLAMMDMGLMPSKVDLAKIMEVAMKNALMKAAYTSHRSDKGAAAQFNFWASGIKHLGELLKENVNVEEQMRDQLSNLQIKHDRLDMPTVLELTEGNVTQDLEPEMKKDGSIPTRDDAFGGEGEEPFEE